MRASRSPSPSKSEPAPSAKKFFTLAQANATLPLVKRVVRDIVNLHAHSPAEKPADPVPAVEAQVEHYLARMQELVEELAVIGCDIKDFRTGLIDFAGRHDGREVCLCWQHGEEQIDFWHEVDAGFKGRRPVSELVEQPAAASHG